MKNLYPFSWKEPNKYLFQEKMRNDLLAEKLDNIEITKKELNFFQKTVDFISSNNKEKRIIKEKYSVEKGVNKIFEKHNEGNVRQIENEYSYNLTTIRSGSYEIKEISESNLSRSQKLKSINNRYTVENAEYLYSTLLQNDVSKEEAQELVRTKYISKQGSLNNADYESSLKEKLGEETFQEFKRNEKYQKFTNSKRGRLELEVAEGKITQEDAQKEFDKYVKKQIKKDPDLKDYYSELVEKAKNHKEENQAVKDIYESQIEEKTVSREKISKVIDFAGKSGLDLNSVNPAEAGDGSLSFEIEPKKIVGGITTKIVIKISESGVFSVENKLFDKEKKFTSKEELNKIVEFSEYSTILHQVALDNAEKPKELEETLSDDNFAKIINSFKLYSFSKNQNPREIFKRICEDMAKEHKDNLGEYLLNLSQKPSSLLKEDVFAKTTNELAKDINLGSGQSNEFAPNNG